MKSQEQTLEVKDIEARACGKMMECSPQAIKRNATRMRDERKQEMLGVKKEGGSKR